MNAVTEKSYVLVFTSDLVFLRT